MAGSEARTRLPGAARSGSRGRPEASREGEELQAKATKANRPDLHSNVFAYLVRRANATCPYCAPQGGIRIDS